MKGKTDILSVNKERLTRFVKKYLGKNQKNWDPWFMKNVVVPIDAMVKLTPQTIVSKNVFYFK